LDLQFRIIPGALTKLLAWDLVDLKDPGMSGDPRERSDFMKHTPIHRIQEGHPQDLKNNALGSRPPIRQWSARSSNLFNQ
jgi:hypothetical protein